MTLERGGHARGGRVPSGRGRARAARLVLSCLAGVSVAVLAFLMLDCNGLVPDLARVTDSFWEQRAEERFLEVWRRQAIHATWEECRVQLDLCVGKIVFWEVRHPQDGTTCVEGNCSRRVFWSNEDQVPGSAPGDTFTAVGRVLAVRPDGLELVFLGTPRAPYGGTTRADGPSGRRAGRATRRAAQ